MFVDVRFGQTDVTPLLRKNIAERNVKLLGASLSRIQLAFIEE